MCAYGDEGGDVGVGPGLDVGLPTGVVDPPTGVVVPLAGCPIVPVFPPCIIICSASGSYTNSHSL